jgi:hypothetical protein
VIYTLIVLAATIVIARRTPGRNVQPLIWLTILILASLRSPYLPQYGLFAVLWLLTLLAAAIVPSVRTLCLVLTAWVVLNFAIPVNGPDPRLLAARALVSQAIIVVLLALALRHRQESSVALQPVGSPS